jgi:hypothetical protein
MPHYAANGHSKTYTLSAGDVRRHISGNHSCETAVGQQ